MNSNKALFLQQSYFDSFDLYQSSVSNQIACWDYIVLTASNDSQAYAYSQQIELRKKEEKLPFSTHFAIVPDPEDKRVGSGGATLNVLQYIASEEHKTDFSSLKILCIHSGGDSKRIPQYSACGKLFSPVPRMLPDGRRSTLFDEFLISMSGVPGRIENGMLVCSGDVLLLFNSLQIDYHGKGAAAFSIKEDVDTGKDHGVYLGNEEGNVSTFLHKQTVQTLTESGAVDKNGNVDIDTGAVFLDSAILNDLYSLIDSKDKFASMVNPETQLSFYADFLYPMASESTLDAFYNEKPEGTFNDKLHDARILLWNKLHKYKMKLIKLSPGAFIHFGTTRELLDLMTVNLKSFKFLGWTNIVNCNSKASSYSASNSYISRRAEIGDGSYVEDSYIHHGTKVCKRCIVSGVTLQGETIPDNTVIHGLKLANGKFVARMYAVDDNPKSNVTFGRTLEEPLWTADLFPVCDTMAEAVAMTLGGIAAKQMTSLKDSFNQADVAAIIPWQAKLDDKVKAESILDAIAQKLPVSETIKEYPFGVSARVKQHLLRHAERLDENDMEQFSEKIRVFYYLSKLIDKKEMEDKCFSTICNSILSFALKGTKYHPEYRIAKDESIIRLPLRVNWGGGWSDTPPYCLENGGTVLNAAITLNGQFPIEVTLRKTDSPKFILESTDIGAYKEFDSVSELQSCNDPFDSFALHKAALIACGIIPHDTPLPFSEVLSNLGSGLYMNTRVINVPKGSGLGTSSILSGACVKALYDFIGVQLSDDDLYNRVLCMEQLMSTGGGWQDQVGGLAPGIKMVTSGKGISQKILCSPLNLSPDTLDELKQRFALIFTGQRRLARNLLREVVGKYIGYEHSAVEVLYKIQQLAVLMRFELEKGNVDGFAELLNEHWELSKKLDSGCTNTCIDQLFLSIDDLIDGRMICGAGGGGFIQVIMKKGVTTDDLSNRLSEVFSDSGVAVYKCEFYGV